MYPRETVDRALALYAELGDTVAVCRAMGGRPSRSAIGYWVREAGLCAPRGGCFLSIRSDQKYHQELNIPMICFCTSRSRDMASLRT